MGFEEEQGKGKRGERDDCAPRRWLGLDVGVLGDCGSSHGWTDGYCSWG